MMKKLLLIPGVLIIMLVIVFVAAGAPLVLDFVRQRIEQTAGGTLGLPVKIGSLGGNLFFFLRATDIETPGLGRVAGLEITYNPVGLLSRHIDIRSLHLEGIELDIDRLSDVLANLPKKADSSRAESSPLKIQIERFSISEGGVGLKLGDNPLNMVVSARGTLLQDRLAIDTLHVSARRSAAVLKGVVPLAKTADLDLIFDIDLAAEDLDVAVLSGFFASTGTVRGKVAAPIVKALTRVSATIMDNHVDGVVDLTWSLPYFDSLVVRGDLRLTTAALQRGTGEHDTWDVQTSLEYSRFTADVQSRYGNMQAKGILKGTISQPDFEGRVSGRFDHQGFKPSFKGTVSFKDDVLKVTQLRLESRRVSMDADLCYNLKTERFSASELSVYINDLGVMRSIIDAPEDVTGQLWLDIEGSGSVESFDAVARMRLSELAAFGERINSAQFFASMQNNMARLDSGTIKSSRGLVELQGHYDINKDDFSLEIMSESLRFGTPEVFGSDTLILGGTVGLSMGFSGDVRNPRGQGKLVFNDIMYDTLQLGTYALDFVFADTTLQISLADEHNTLLLGAEATLKGDVPFGATVEFRHFVLDRFTTPAVGYVTGDVQAKGNLSDLRQATCALHVDTVELAFENNRLHNVEPVLVDLEEGVVKLHRFKLGVAGQTIQLQGTLPVDFEIADMDISGKSSDIQLSEIVHFLPKNPPLAGRLNFDVRIQGKPRRLDIDGNLILEGGSYLVEDVSFDSISGRFFFKNGLVTCKELTGKINNGRFEASGFVDVSRGRLDTLSFETELNRIDYANKNFGRILLDADLQADGRRDSLRINGEIVVVEGVYDAPMKLQTFTKLLTNANRPEPQQPEMAKRIYCDIGITVPDSIVIANNVADLSARADLQLKGYLAHLNAYGTISAIDEGTLKYLGRKFTIVNAVIQFDDPYKIDPFIDLAATSTISAVDGDYIVTLLLNGTVATWQLELSSNPPLPQQDIVSLLLIGQRRPGDVGNTVKDIDLKGKAKSYALDAVRYGIEKSGEKLLDLDKVTITGELDDLSSVRVGIEKSITRNFTLLYTTGIDSWELHQVGASYDVTDHVSIFTLYDQENLNTSVDLDFHFKIR